MLVPTLKAVGVATLVNPLADELELEEALARLAVVDGEASALGGGLVGGDHGVVDAHLVAISRGGVLVGQHLQGDDVIPRGEGVALVEKHLFHAALAIEIHGTHVLAVQRDADEGAVGHLVTVQGYLGAREAEGHRGVVGAELSRGGPMLVTPHEAVGIAALVNPVAFEIELEHPRAGLAVVDRELSGSVGGQSGERGHHAAAEEGSEGSREDTEEGLGSLHGVFPFMHGWNQWRNRARRRWLSWGRGLPSGSCGRRRAGRWSRPPRRRPGCRPRRTDPSPRRG